jgi:hypothetical protein
LHERHEPLERAVVAPDATKAVHALPAAEEAARLPFDEGGQADALGARGRAGAFLARDGSASYLDI